MTISKGQFYNFDQQMEQLAIFIQESSDILASNLELEIKRMIASGMGVDTVREILYKDLAEGGRLFAGFNSTFKKSAFPMIDNVAQGSVMDMYADANRFEWVTTSAEPCPDCTPRHGLVKEYGEWVELGLPRSGFSVCKENCKCVLVPEGKTGQTIADGPVKVKTLAERRAEYEAGK